MRFSTAFAAALSLGVACAEVINVTVGENSTLSFTPAQVTASEGDTIAFTLCVPQSVQLLRNVNTVYIA